MQSVQVLSHTSPVRIRHPIFEILLDANTMRVYERENEVFSSSILKYWTMDGIVVAENTKHERILITHSGIISILNI